MRTQQKEFVFFVILMGLTIGHLIDHPSSSADENLEKILEYQGSGLSKGLALQAAGATTSTLSNGVGDGFVMITVDAYGSFGFLTPSGNANYDLIGTAGPAGTTFESGLYFGPLGNFLTTDRFGLHQCGCNVRIMRDRWAV